jgi:hypothetical protein
MTTEIPTVAQTIIDTTLSTVLGDLQRLKVHQEVGIPVLARKKIQFTYCPMITYKDIPPQFFLNGSQTPLIEDTDYEFDTDATDPLDIIPTGLNAGRITLLDTSDFPSATLPVGSEIKGEYVFQYFSDDDLCNYLNMALWELNARPPKTAKVWDAIPLEWNAALTLYSAAQCFQQILNDTTLWKSRIIFADPQAMRDQITNNLSQLNQRLDYVMKVMKRRGEARPLTVVSSKIAVQQRVTQSNWQNFAIIQ